MNSDAEFFMPKLHAITLWTNPRWGLKRCTGYGIYPGYSEIKYYTNHGACL